MEVPPNSLFVLKERGSPTTTTWGGGTLGGVGGRRSSVQAASTPSKRSSQGRQPTSQPLFHQVSSTPSKRSSQGRRPTSQPLFHQEEVSSIQASTTIEAKEEFVNSAWRGQRTSEEREPSPLGERRTPPRGRSPILLLLNQWSSVGKSESVKGRVNETVFKSCGRSFCQSALIS